ncbi:MAG: trigger factor [Candidatus Eisenbacteria bacterium]|uniref:Trigger factor n=1 Tax=Eiseniibacteriota bacterium TaxID=2212470 RepID=A0A7Y2E6B5_UNCEI|nr:trigger factor [Candidatus Eisenbacteria bacterium]
MKVTVTEEPAWKRVLDIEVDNDQVEKEKKAVIESFRKTLNLPGFRKGKVPFELAEKHLGDSLGNELLQRVIPRALDEALRENSIRPLGDPSIDDLHFEPGEPLKFKASVEIAPELEITGYKGLAVTKEVPNVDSDMIDETFDALREQRATPGPVDRPAKAGDIVKISYLEQGTEDQDPIEAELEIGGERTPEAFSKGLEGAAAGDKKAIDLPFPDDYPDVELAGKAKTFDVEVVEVQEKVWPELDDSFAQGVMGKEDATVEMLREQIQLNHEAEAQMHAQRVLTDSLVGKILELNPFDVPQGLVNRTIERIVAQAEEQKPLPEEEKQKLADSYREGVENRYRFDFLINALAKQEEIQVSDKDLDKEIEGFASRENQPAAKIKAQLKKEGGLDRLYDDLLKRRVTEKLLELADITEVSVDIKAQEG